MTTQTTSRTARSNLLRRVLQSDGVLSGVSGAVLIVGARPLASLFGLEPPAILVITGIVFLCYAVGLFVTISRKPIDRRLALTAAILNTAWVVGSAVILLTGWLPLTTAGKWMIAFVADIVAVFAALQFYGVWRE